MTDKVTELELLKLSKMPPSRVVSFFKKKGYAISWDWREVWRDEHARAFTVAKAAKDDILQTLRRGVDQAISSGWSERRFIREMTPTLQKLGWWGQKQVINPAGNLQLVQLGAPWRLKTIYRTNMYTSFSRGRYRTLRANVANRPYWLYDAMNDSLTRPSHRDLDNKVYPALHPVWDRIYPPNGFNCRCMVRALTEDQVKAKGLKIQDMNIKLPKNFPDNGWDFNPATQTVGQLAAKVRLKPYKPPKRLIPPKPVIPRTVAPPTVAAPVAKPAPTKPTTIHAPESLEADGRPIVRQEWVEGWLRSGTLKLKGRIVPGSATLEKLFGVFDHAKEMTLFTKRGAAYFRNYRGIKMNGHKTKSKPQNRATFRHEAGHYFDHRLGEAKLGKRGKTYRSSLPDAQRAVAADMSRLSDLGRDRYLWARKADDVLEQVDEYNTVSIRQAWDVRISQIKLEARRKALRPDGTINGDIIRKTISAEDEPNLVRALEIWVNREVRNSSSYDKAVGILAKGEGIIAKVFDEATKAGHVFTSSEAVIWGEAAAAGDLSVLLRYHHPLTAVFDKRGWSAGNFSDLIGALSNERVGGWSWQGSGHGTAYYSSRIENTGGAMVRAGNGTEAFANMTDALLYRHDPLYQDLLQALAPNFTKWFDEIIGEVVNGVN